MARGWRTVAALAIVGMMTSGCATIVYLGSSEELNVSSEPSGATVVIDGTERGVTPLATKAEKKRSCRGPDEGRI